MDVHRAILILTNMLTIIIMSSAVISTGAG
jgi:hypothetical protein